MRLIDADALKQFEITMPRGDGYSDFVFAGHIHQAPTIDAVPVVRCKDCVHYYKGWGEELCHRGWTPKDVSKEWFCPKGERRDDAEQV